ncbi:MAG: hypothetical protein IJ207_10545 [Treponema sp.]|uniref:hypothetical protein n=1 Tax=Treponema sp. TaxID=166 RepID=UPI0025D44A20|nr:hypothetical protein [Treponema sp.]MBQ9282613.1 hypothetical protein [Treponema sp.]
MKKEFVSEKDVMDFFKMLNENHVCFLLIKNTGDELPAKLKPGKNIGIIVNPADKLKFAEVMKKNDFLYRIHPFGREHGWNFAYNLESHQFWQKKNSDYFVDVCFALCVKSLSPMVWVPLDEKINSRVWKNSVLNEKLGCSQLDEKTLLVYLIAHCLFDKRCFSDSYVKAIGDLKSLLGDEDVRKMLKTVFYEFTDSLINLVHADCYSKIFSSYLSFTEY